MKPNKFIRLVFTLVCFGFSHGLAGNITCLWATMDTGELVMGEEALDAKTHTGRLDYIDKERVVINDFPLHVLENTHYRTIGGAVTTSDHFSAGDAVSFVTDTKETVLLELQMKGADTEEQPKDSRTIKSGGNFQFKEGVWTN